MALAQALDQPTAKAKGKSMAFDKLLGERMRKVLKRKRGITDKEVFGGLAFLVDGKMFCGVIGDKMVVRVGPEHYEEALAKPHTTKMDFTGKPMKGYVYVKKDGLRREPNLITWISLGLAFTKSLSKKRR